MTVKGTDLNDIAYCDSSVGLTLPRLRAIIGITFLTLKLSGKLDSNELVAPLFAYDALGA
jgi:hypothetical protein